MKQLKFFMGACLLVLCCGGLHADHVHYGDYTLPGVFDGELTIIAGNLDLTDSFTINADLKIISGKVIVRSTMSSTSTVDLYVHGDLIVTNTEVTGDMDATITVSTGKIVVTGEIFTKSSYGGGSIDGRYGIKAGQIETNGRHDSSIESMRGSVEVVGDIFAISEGDAHIRANGDLCAASVFADGKGFVFVPPGGGGGGGDEGDPGGDPLVPGGDPVGGPGDLPGGATSAFINVGGSIDVGGMIVTKSLYGSAFIQTATVRPGYLRADSVFTRGQKNSSIIVGEEDGYIDVANDIVATSTKSHAIVRVHAGHIKAGNVATRAYSEGDVWATTFIDVWGDINTQSMTDQACVGEETIPTIKAKSITTSAKGDAYVRATELIDVGEAIVTRCWDSGDADIKMNADPGTPGAIIAGSIKTEANDGLGNVEAQFGSITSKGTINTHSTQGHAKVATTAGNIDAENVYTNAYDDASVEADGGSSKIDVKDVIETKSVAGDGYVKAEKDLLARAIRTETYNDGYIESSDTSIIVQEDISTRSENGDAYVKAENGDITAQRIRTQAPTGQDDSIWAQPGSGNFMFVLNEEDVAKTIKDSEFDLLTDHEWNTMLTLKGTCTINGKGHKITFGPNGGIIVDTDAKLLLNNIKINNVWGESIKCEDDTGILQLHNVTWSQTADYAFKNGKMEVSGLVLVSGPGTGFMYESSQVSTIQARSMFSFSTTMTLRYNTGGENRVAMVDETSRLNFNGSSFGALQDIRFTKGTLVFDDKVIFSAPAGRTIYFGDNTLAENNINFEFHVSSHLNKEGSGSIVDENV